MYQRNKLTIAGILMCIALSFVACNKQYEWLEAKSAKNKVTPETLQDFQAILDSSRPFNMYTNGGLIGTDDVYLKDAAYLSSPEYSRNLYLWDREAAPGISNEWTNCFKRIAYANIVLEGLRKISETDNQYNNVKGQALFHRALAYYQLVQLFCHSYGDNASVAQGLPVRLSADVNEVSPRFSLAATYQQILEDAIQAAALVSDVPLYLRPGSAAAFALVAKTYLHKGDYEKSLAYAVKCLTVSSKLIDFNNKALVNPATEYRFPVFAKGNPEVLFYAEASSYLEVVPDPVGTGQVSPELYNSYEDGDLRKSIFYDVKGTDIRYKGSYTGRFSNFCGIATNEVYLIRAECNARLGNVIEALQDLRTLLTKRYLTGHNFTLPPQNADEVLSAILTERRKELAFVAEIRWEDLKRLNKETRFQKTLKRVVNAETFMLPPNDKRYVLPIPLNETELSGIDQNER